MTDSAESRASSFGFAASSSRREARHVKSSATRPFLSFLTACTGAFLLSIGLIWAYVASYPMAFLDRDYPLWMAKRSMMDRCMPVSLAVFGDSRTVAGIMPRALSVPATNFALSGTSPIETYFAVRRLLRCKTAPKLVVIAHGALKFTGDSDYWRFGARTGFFSYSDMRSIEQEAEQLHDNSIGEPQVGDRLPSWLRDWLYSVRFPLFYFDSLLHGYVAGRWRHNIAAEEDNLRSFGHALFGTLSGSNGIAGEAAASGFEVSPLVDLYFSRTLELLEAKHVPVLIVTMPVNRATYVRSPPQLRDQFAQYLRERADRFDNIAISEPVISCWPDAFYGDAWHFNAAGAAAFSRELDGLLMQSLNGERMVRLPDHCSGSL